MKNKGNVENVDCQLLAFSYLSMISVLCTGYGYHRGKAKC